MEQVYVISLFEGTMSQDNAVEETNNSARFKMSILNAEREINEKLDKILKVIEQLRDRLVRELRSKEQEYDVSSDCSELKTLSRNKTQIEDMFRDNTHQDLLEDNVHRIEWKMQRLKEKLSMQEVTVKWQLEDFYFALKNLVQLSSSGESPPRPPPKKEIRSLTMPSESMDMAPRIPARGAKPRVVRMPSEESTDQQPEQDYIEMKPSKNSANPFSPDPLIKSASFTDMRNTPSKVRCLSQSRNSNDPLPLVNENSYLPFPPGGDLPQPPLPPKTRAAERRSSQLSPLKGDQKILGMHIERVTPKFVGCNRGKENQDLYKASTVDVDITTSDIYVADTYNHCIKVFNKDGTFKFLFGRKSPGKLEYPFGLCISGKQVYVGEKVNGKIKAYELGGQFLKEITGDGTKRGQYKFLWGIAADSENGDIYACDNENDRIQVYSRNLEFRHTVIGPGRSGNVTGPVDVKVRSMMVVVLDQGDPCVHYFDKQGMKLWSMVEFKEAKVSMAPQCFTFDIEDNILITDAATHTIRIFTPKGELYVAIGKKGERAGEFLSPTGIALDTVGNIVCICQREKANLQILTYTA